MKIAILDDESCFTEMAKPVIAQAFSLLKEEIAVDTFTEIASFLLTHEQEAFNLVFLDIDMPEISGLVLAEQIRRINRDTDVIFLSNQEHLVFRAIECQPFRFIRKRFLKEEINPAAVAYLKRYNEKNVKITLEINRHKHVLLLNDVLYFESNRHQLILHMVNDQLRFRGEISTWEKQLTGHYFVRVHSGYLVNMKFVKSIGKTELSLDDDTALPVSRRKVADVKAVFQQFLREQF